LSKRRPADPTSQDSPADTPSTSSAAAGDNRRDGLIWRRAKQQVNPVKPIDHIKTFHDDLTAWRRIGCFAGGYGISGDRVT